MMEDHLLEGYAPDSLDIDKELLMSFFDKDNREREGAEMPMSLRKMNINELMRRLNTSAHQGISLDESEILKRRNKYGNNLMTPEKTPRKTGDNDYSDVNLSRKRTISAYTLDHFKDKMWSILLLCCLILLAISIFEENNSTLNTWLIGTTVLSMYVLILILHIIFERYKHNTLLNTIREMENKIEVTVIRDSKEFVIKQSELVVGDIVILSGGDAIPADCVVIEANLQAKVDESYLTPDINPVQKKAIKVFQETFEKQKEESKQSYDIEIPDPFLLASTFVISGRMKALVLAVGRNTYVRSQNLHSPYYTIMGEKRTILQSKIDRIVNNIGKYSLPMCIIILSTMFFKHIWVNLNQEEANYNLKGLEIFGGTFYLITYFCILLIMFIPVGLSNAVEFIITYIIKISSEN